MSIEIPVFWNDLHGLHEPGGEVWVGVRTPGTEVPARAERIRVALERCGARFVPAERQDEVALLAVHGPELIAYLRRAWNEWDAGGLTEDPGQDRVVPYLFPHPGLLAGMEPPRPTLPTALTAQAGRFAYDTMTLIGPGTWEAARGAVDAAATAADLVIAGATAAYACCRPPGHHAARDAFGGSCYLNNAAAAAARLRTALASPVAVIDVDAHHGNGTQTIFFEDPGVLTGSVHVDPGAGWFPHFLGFAGERGAGAASGTNLNLPLDPGSGDEAWLAAIDRLSEWARDGGAEALVVPLGVDAAGGDPESPLDVTADGFHEAGRILGALGLPTVLVQEGGYDLDAIGELVVATLTGFQEGSGGFSPRARG